MCVFVRLFHACVCVCVCMHTWLHLSVLMHVLAQASVSGRASRLLAIMSSTVVVRGILVIASDPQASSPRCITDRGVTQPKGSSFSIDLALRGNPAEEMATVKYGLHLLGLRTLHLI